jgi:protein-S-isoprenylcysteine O-methyltransferase Ste14
MVRLFPGVTVPYPGGFYLFGFLLFLGGLILRWYSIGYLGRYFTVDVSISAEHKLIDSGPYRYIRHPTYTGALLAFLGLGFCFGNWLSILFLTLPIIAAFLWRIGGRGTRPSSGARPELPRLCGADETLNSVRLLALNV